MGNEMNKVLAGLFIGSARDAHDVDQLSRNEISHILAIHEYAQPDFPDKKYLCVMIPDHPSQNIGGYFMLCNDFIHKARHQGNVLVHCQMGVSRSATVVIAYLMALSHCGWRDALNMLKSVRPFVNPNLGFQKQLLIYEKKHVEQERVRLNCLNVEKRSEDFVGSFKLLSIISCSKLGPHEHKMEVDSDVYPLTLNAYGIKDTPYPSLSPNTVTYYDPQTNSSNVSVSGSLSAGLITEKSKNQAAFFCRNGQTVMKSDVKVIAAKQASTVPVAAENIPPTKKDVYGVNTGNQARTVPAAVENIPPTKKDFYCVNDRALGSAFAKSLCISSPVENNKTIKTRDVSTQVCDSDNMAVDAVRQIGREYLRKHVRIWSDLSETDDSDENSNDVSKSKIEEKSEKSENHDSKNENQTPSKLPAEIDDKDRSISVHRDNSWNDEKLGCLSEKTPETDDDIALFASHSKFDMPFPNGT